MFSRGRGRHSRPDESRRGVRHGANRRDELDAELPEAQAARGGPYDVSEAPDDVPRLDLGALQIPAVDGVEVRVQADPEGVIQQVVLVHGDNALQLGAFAAPRSEGIWDEVREEIRSSLFEQGVAAQEVPGEYGTELRARVRAPEGLTDIRFVGIDGPRWMVRAVFQGAAAVDPSTAGPLASCLRELVVDRGHEALPVREPLPLHLPREVAEQAAGAGQPEPGAPRPDDAQRAPVPSAGEQPTQVIPRVNGAEPGAAPQRRPSPRPRRH